MQKMDEAEREQYYAKERERKRLAREKKKASDRLASQFKEDYEDEIKKVAKVD